MSDIEEGNVKKVIRSEIESMIISDFKTLSRNKTMYSMVNTYSKFAMVIVISASAILIALKFYVYATISLALTVGLDKLSTQSSKEEALIVNKILSYEKQYDISFKIETTSDNEI